MSEDACTDILVEVEEEGGQVEGKLDVQLALACLHLCAIEYLALVVDTGAAHARAVQVPAPISRNLTKTRKERQR